MGTQMFWHLVVHRIDVLRLQGTLTCLAYTAACSLLGTKPFNTLVWIDCQANKYEGNLLTYKQVEIVSFITCKMRRSSLFKLNELILYNVKP